MAVKLKFEIWFVKLSLTKNVRASSSPCNWGFKNDNKDVFIKNYNSQGEFSLEIPEDATNVSIRIAGGAGGAGGSDVNGEGGNAGLGRFGKFRDNLKILNLVFGIKGL